MSIQLEIGARMYCVEPGCKASQKVKLCLCPSGRFVISAAEGEWQVGSVSGDGPYLCRCPAHRKKISPVLGKSILDAGGKELVTG